MQAYVDHGELVPDSVMLRVIEQRVVQADVRRHGFLMDGFPRTVEQAEGFTDIIGPEALCAAIQIEVPTDVVLARILGRRVCPTCGTTTSAPREVARIPCPRGDGWAVRRKDDTETAIRRRLDLYDEESRYLVKWFDERGLLLTVDGAASPDTVYDATLRGAAPRALGRPASGGLSFPRRRPPLHFGRLLLASLDNRFFARSGGALRRPVSLYLTTMFSIPASGVGICGSIFSSASTSSSATATVRTHLRSDGTTNHGDHFVEVSVIASS